MSDSLNYRSGPFIQRPAPVGSGVLIEIGDLLKVSSGKVTPMATTTDNLAFCGVAAQRHSTTDGSGTVNVYLPLPSTVFEYTLDATTSVVFGNELQFNTKSKLKVSSTDAIASCVKSELSATKVLVVFKLTNSNTGLKLVGDAS